MRAAAAGIADFTEESEGHLWLFLDLPEGIRVDAHLRRKMRHGEDLCLLQAALDQISLVMDYTPSQREHMELGMHFFSHLLEDARSGRAGQGGGGGLESNMDYSAASLHHFQNVYESEMRAVKSGGQHSLSNSDWRCIVSHLGALLSSRGEAEKALDILHQACLEDPHPSLFYSLACVRAQLGQSELALEDLISAFKAQLCLPGPLQVFVQDPSQDLAFRHLWKDKKFREISSLFTEAEHC